MRILLTEWALSSYTELFGTAFTWEEYRDRIRPDILVLRDSADTRLRDSRFWSLAESGENSPVPDGFKMKWHNLGPGRVQLRLAVARIGNDNWLCHAYNKTSAPLDYRMGALLRNRIRLIRERKVRFKTELR